MLNDTPNVMTELVQKRPRFVEIIEIYNGSTGRLPANTFSKNILLGDEFIFLSCLAGSTLSLFL